MLPVVANITTLSPALTPLTNTAVAGSTVLHVPADNVAPSVSNAQVDNNARANPALPISSNASADTSAASSVSQDVAATSFNQTLSAAAQAPFLAQLAAQDSDSVPTQVILVQYEKLISIGNVKYKPSNAGKPSIDITSQFNQIVEEKPVIHQPVIQVESPPPATPHNAPAAAVVSQPPAPVIAPSVPAPPATQQPQVTTQAVKAYTASASRISLDNLSQNTATSVVHEGQLTSA